MNPTADRQTATLQTIQEVKPNTFIFEKQRALALDICAEMIRRFEASEADQYPGRIGQTVQEEQSIKRSTDLVVSGKEHWRDIDRELFRSLGMAIREFREAYPFFRGPFKDSGYAIQRTNPGEFYHWHIDGGSHEFSQRQLVAVWYLNDVEGPGGETEFSYQQVKIRPEAGKLLLFPPFWTHEHRGVTLREGVKYIATTWVVFA
ncbi:MAG: 2OG-Fe(II) oxygenase [Anderseniella sp.]|nr:2OG-Fe(II) oxygenase [Anderseniella sp.]